MQTREREGRERADFTALLLSNLMEIPWCRYHVTPLSQPTPLVVE